MLLLQSKQISLKHHALFLLYIHKLDNPFQVQEDDDLTIIKKGKPVNYFIMIVEGKVNVTIGGEELEFEAGPFSYYGIKALTQVTQSMAAAVDGKAPGSVYFLFMAPSFMPFQASYHPWNYIVVK